ncbi:hypothetical protein QAD02_020976 [Eretmocerus hayati]|uniref:Uncharacterized protein n=1 Tax=Eretmocerus hayati TaxID=131215 RepID=A0ACC2PQ93_9HYME|nr:hypothetical protein QAD02_020976 [Eretmocerus hayati]
MVHKKDDGLPSQIRKSVREYDQWNENGQSCSSTNEMSLDKETWESEDDDPSNLLDGSSNSNPGKFRKVSEQRVEKNMALNINEARRSEETRTTFKKICGLFSTESPGRNHSYASKSQPVSTEPEIQNRERRSQSKDDSTRDFSQLPLHEQLMLVKGECDEILQNQAEITVGMNQSVAVTRQDFSDLEQYFTIKTEDEFVEFNKKLKSSVYSQRIRDFSATSTVEEAKKSTLSVLAGLIHDKLAKKFTFGGRNGKKEFRIEPL